MLNNPTELSRVLSRVLPHTASGKVSFRFRNYTHHLRSDLFINFWLQICDNPSDNL